MKTTVIVIVLVLAAAGLTWLMISSSSGGGEGEPVTTRSGLVYVDTKIGTGKEAKKGDTVTVHYTGMLEDGKKFDSSVGKKPLTFELGAGEVIKGWDEGVAGMKERGKRKLMIPPDLGYGERGAGKGLIPPNAVLLFDVELLKVN